MDARSTFAALFAVGASLCACATSDDLQRRDARTLEDSATRDAIVAMDAATDVSMDVASDAPASDTAARDSRASDAPVDDRSAADAAMCPAGQTRCGAECVDLNTSTTHCGLCDGPCDPMGTSRVACVAGMCEITCDRLHGNCDFNNFNGCETPFEDDPMNCGACGNHCFRTQNCCSGRCVDTPCP